ncbi:MAG: T9SS type A sorting domain-containing protein [candidate division Zixibacteria bacterium]|nr:T9SS type A sorting domain-containing protein [candidate division Zixibacteria bacterium]
MKKALVIFVLAMFWCSFALATDAFLSKNMPVDKELNITIPSYAAEIPADMVTDTEEYCASTYTNMTDDWITYVEFNTIANQTEQDGPSSYGDYTDLETVVEGGATYTLTVTFFSDGSWTEHVRAWIDWNMDEIFDVEESYYLGSGVDATLTIDIEVPMGGPEGATVLRVIEQYSTDPGADGACDGQGNHTAIYGETEDYTVIVGEAGPCDVVCPPEGIEEGEDDCGDEYVDTYNGGCNSDPSIFQDIAPGQTICGTSGTYLVAEVQNRDTDWFTFTPEYEGPITFEVEAEFNVLIFVIDAGTGNCEDLEIISNITGEPCVEISLTHVPTPGQEYWYWVGPSEFTGWDCPLEYNATLTQEDPPLGGEDCESAVVIDTPLPYQATGNTCDYLDDCELTGSNDNSDVIFELTVEEEMTIICSLVGSEYDTKIGVFMTDCCSGAGTEFLYNDDFDGLQSQVEGVFMPGVYYVVVDGYSSACGNFLLNISEGEPPPPPACDQSYIGPDDSWNFVTSDVEVGPYKVYDNFFCEDETQICGMTWWGLDLEYNSGWFECDEVEPEFEISFYPDLGNAPDYGNPTCTFYVTPNRTNTGIMYGGSYELIEYQVDFDECCQVNGGWVSVQGMTFDGCSFLWAASFDGDALSYQEQNGSPVVSDADLSREFDFMTSIDETELLPTQIDMLANYPNPFNAQTKIAFSLKESGNVSIEIYDVLGRRIDRLEMGHLSNTEIHTVDYDAGNLATGVYFYSLMVDGEKRASERFSLLK